MNEHSKPKYRTVHAEQRMTQRGVTEGDLDAACEDAYVICQADGHREVRGVNGLTFITDASGEVLVTVLPPGARPYRHARKDCGVSRHRLNRRGPRGRNDQRKAHS